MKPGDDIVVKTNVARDLLQNAALFKTDKLVVWEYVSNGLQYVDPGTVPSVRVVLDGKKKRISVEDNGRGMDWEGLQNFFIMHGENLDRKEGRPGRGRFGTGKSAAFGIADTLRITTVQDGILSKVALSRADIDSMTSEDPVPVRTLEREVLVAEPNGTRVEIEGIHLRSLDQQSVIQYVERHLAKWPRNSVVLVNNHECEFTEPSVWETRTFWPEGELAVRLGQVGLVLKLSKAPLEEELRGVSVYSNGVWHETTLAGNDGREMANYIFGEIDIPYLDTDTSAISPFDLSRSMQLNPSNELVQAVYGFVGQSIDEVRRELVAAERDRRADENSRKLSEQAAEIAKVINQDFDDFRQRLARARARAPGGSDMYRPESDGTEEGNHLLFGEDFPAELVLEVPANGSGKDSDTVSPEPRERIPEVVEDPLEREQRGKLGGIGEGRRKAGGGFDVDFLNMGEESHRAKYVSEQRTIFINLDHPQLRAALGDRQTDDPVFRRLAYEVAFSEYAVALASELARRDEYVDPSDPIVDIRDTLNRVARRAASLYED